MTVEIDDLSENEKVDVFSMSPSRRGCFVWNNWLVMLWNHVYKMGCCNECKICIFFFVVYVNHKNTFTAKISRSTVYYYQDFITLLLLFDGWEGTMAGYCTLVLYFHSPGPHKNTTTHVHYPTVLPSQPSNNIYLTSMECNPCMHHRWILLLAS